ncbi:MAG: FAD-binding protein [Clostridia bacterium]|nr:FAD-binding protein [Clostridia bacterium]
MGSSMEYCTYDALVIGTGAAGYHGALRIQEFGKKNVAIITECIYAGTSRNSGSDKQTYYKLGLGGDSADSVAQMARDLFANGAVDGDNALCEAALSARCFLNLCELGVAFPVNRYGEYCGYKTDHDPYARATSAGPLTSKDMTEALERKVQKLGIPVYDDLLAVELLQDEQGICGLICLEQKTGALKVFRTRNVVMAVGGPGGIYADSVYPMSQNGGTGIALRAGAKLQNVTEWQFGLASVNPRWNVSGTYMQVLPRFISVGEDGEEREFLMDYFTDPYEALSNVFLKGYQWPFDSKKVLRGSSVIDLLVYRENVLKGRKVYLDFRKNPFGLQEIDYTRLAPEAYAYLEKAKACFGTPIERLYHMNEPAVRLYRDKGVRLEDEPLEIALCAQHHNGGIAVDLWWQTNIPGLFAAGECAGTHGVARPGGSALNAGQVGSLRAAQYISAKDRPEISKERFESILPEALSRHEAIRTQALANENNGATLIQMVRRNMSRFGAAIRKEGEMQQALDGVMQMQQDLPALCGVSGPDQLYLVYRLRDILVTQGAVLSAMIDFSKTVGVTRGSSLYTAPEGELREGLEELFRLTTDGDNFAGQIQETYLEGNTYVNRYRPVRPIPTEDAAFETIWQSYRECGNIY